MPVLVMKFGGTSVATLDRIKRAAKRVGVEVSKGYDVIVIVSAMSGETNKLVGYVDETSPLYDAREYDAIVSSGENVTAGLMALTLQEMDVPARSWQGWQVPVKTTSAHSSARIEEIPTDNITAKFGEGMKVAVVAGFQGVSPEGRITTLGRGGSDTTAVAFAAAFEAIRCDIYTDVDGVYTTDPRVTDKARKLDRIAFEEMLELASLGAKVLQTRSVELAMRYKVRLRVLSSFEEQSDDAGTLVCAEEEIMESNVVAGVAFSRDEAKMTLISVADRPGIAAAIFGPLAEAGVNVDMIVQNISEEGRTDMTFSCPTAEVKRAQIALGEAKDAGDINFNDLVADTDVAKVSIVGIGMRSHAGVAAKMFTVLRDEGVNIKVITTSEIKVSVLIDRKYMELAVQALHDAFELEKIRVIVRPLGAKDRAAWDALYDLYAQFYEVAQTPEMRATVWDWLNDPDHEVSGFVADDAGTLVGFAHCRVFARPLAAASGLYLDDLFVSPAARGSGAAAALIDAMKSKAVADGHSVVRWITASDNARARGLYDKIAVATQWVTYDLKV